jgi:tetratricopeptide (TPR) repeat protein
LALYERQLHTCYATHHRRASYEQTSAIQQTIASLYQALPFSLEKEIWQLTSRYHILIASILRDQHLFREALEYLDQAIFLTEYIGDNEFLADALYRQGWVYLERREGEKAAQSFLSAERLLKKLPSYMGGGILIGLGRSLALQTQDMQERLTALHTLDKAAHLLRLYPLPDGNQHYLEIELDRYHLDKAAAFLNIGFPREALRELSLVRSSPHNQRRAAMISVFQAQANVALGKYAEACDLAEEALDLIGPIRSVVNYERIQMLYQELQLTSFRNNPEVARLGVMLHHIQMCWHGKNKQRNRL